MTRVEVDITVKGAVAEPFPVTPITAGPIELDGPETEQFQFRVDNPLARQVNLGWTIEKAGPKADAVTVEGPESTLFNPGQTNVRPTFNISGDGSLTETDEVTITITGDEIPLPVVEE